MTVNLIFCSSLPWLFIHMYFMLIISFHISDGSIYFKVVVPSVAAGVIIGKGGEIITQVQRDVNARLKIVESQVP